MHSYSGLLKRYMLQPLETCCFFSINMQGNHHLQVGLFVQTTSANGHVRYRGAAFGLWHLPRRSQVYPGALEVSMLDIVRTTRSRSGAR